MKKIVRNVLTEAAGIAGDTARFYAGALALPVLLPVAVAGIAAVSAAALGSWIAGTTGRAILEELRRRARLRAPRPPAPSLRGAPSAEELSADWLARPRTLEVRLRLGSRLADLAPTLDSGNQYDVSESGARRIRGRGRGVRGWLADNRVGANYSTAMRYMRLAVRLRALLGLDARLPLEWLLPGAVRAEEVPAGLRGEWAAGKRRLGRLVRSHWNFCRLQEHVDGALGLRRLPCPGRGRGRGGRRKALEEGMAENVRRELAEFVREPARSKRLEALRREAIGRFAGGIRCSGR